jgi:DNA-binding NtrC family response regulator
MRPLLLVAEGDADLRERCRRFLADHGYDVEGAADGLQCLEKLRRLMPSVLVLDRELRWGGGDGVLAWLREQDALARASVVLTTSAAYQTNACAPIRPPVVNLLPKPFTLTALLDSVSAAVADNRRDEDYYLSRPSAC